MTPDQIHLQAQLDVILTSPALADYFEAACQAEPERPWYEGLNRVTACAPLSIETLRRGDAHYRRLHG